MVKRYLKEFANDRKNDFIDIPHDAYLGYCEYADKVISHVDRGIITHLEGVKMIASIDTWELTHGKYKERFNGWK